MGTSGPVCINLPCMAVHVRVSYNNASACQWPCSTVFNVILRMEKKFSISKNARFSGKGRQSLHIYVMRTRKMLISYIRLDHTLYSINYGTQFTALED